MKKYFNIAADCKPQLHNMVGFLEAEKNTLFETMVNKLYAYPVLKDMVLRL